ncbi:hypothetical protein PGB34_08225 [Xenophilus arseniciresistens]|uniref:Lipoprotein n=1 Tax=Xenophilus arseniciresistens TaxID=1283306 RepID=A0AAE3N685_9BURK|nr:hypothetical protein [Xenophilus arseniciresistens]MDA7416350.1 hypothetical protein [Xenophilus arseniciresistens]
MQKTLLACAAGMLATACATARPSLPEDDYAFLGFGLAKAAGCAQQGHMPPELAARGRNLVLSVINAHTYDRWKLQRHVELAAQSPSSPEFCRQMGQGLEEALAQAQTRVTAQAREGQVGLQLREKAGWAPPQIRYCNRVGSQTVCSSAD